MGDLASSSHTRVFYLAVGPDLCPLFEHRAWPQERVGTDARPVADLGPASDGVFDEGAVAYIRVLEVGRGPDHTVRTDPGLSAKEGSRQDHGVVFDLDR